MNTNKFLLALLSIAGVVIFSACNAIGTQVPFTPTSIPPTETSIPPTPTTVSPVTITGKIGNMDEIKQFLYDDATLQLVRVLDDGKVSIAFPAEGGIYVDSDLAEIPIPNEDGVFEFLLEILEPGKYFISAQSFNPPDSMHFNAMLIASDASDPKSAILFEIPKNPSFPYRLDLGDVFVILP